MDSNATPQKVRNAYFDVEKRCLSIISQDDISIWITVCENFYGKNGVDNGSEGVQIVTPFVWENEEYGSISISFFRNSNEILVQGNSFIMWKDIHFPELEKTVKNGGIKPIDKTSQTPCEPTQLHHDEIESLPPVDTLGDAGASAASALIVDTTDNAANNEPPDTACIDVRRQNNTSTISASPTSCPPICYDKETCNISDDGGHVGKTQRKRVHVRNIRRNIIKKKNPECDLLQLFKISNNNILNEITHIRTAINEKQNDSIGNLTRNLEPALFEIKELKNKHQALSRKFIELPFRKR